MKRKIGELSSRPESFPRGGQETTHTTPTPTTHNNSKDGSTSEESNPSTTKPEKMESLFTSSLKQETQDNKAKKSAPATKKTKNGILPRLFNLSNHL